MIDFLTFLIVATIIFLYLMYRNFKTHDLLIKILDDINQQAHSCKTQNDIQEIGMMLNKLKEIDYYKILFSFKSFPILDYQMRKKLKL